jgi:hypothetical protein
VKRDTPVESLEDFEREWAFEYAEWLAIASGLPTETICFDVTEEQRRRMRERGEVSVLDTAFARSRLGLWAKPRLVR